MTSNSSPSASTLRSLCAFLCVAGLCACSARADIPRVEIVQRDVEIPGAGEFGDLLRATTVSFDHPRSFQLPRAYDAELHALGVTATPTFGVEDLSFVEGLVIRLGSRSDDGLEQVELARYDATAGDHSNEDGSLTIPTNPELDVIEFFGSRAAYYEVSISGELPPDMWRIDIQASFSGELAL